MSRIGRIDRIDVVSCLYIALALWLVIFVNDNYPPPHCVTHMVHGSVSYDLCWLIKKG